MKIHIIGGPGTGLLKVCIMHGVAGALRKLMRFIC